ncbi:MAG: mismatch-specific DNA-glycosylase [Chloroflexi bacterium]|nr:mismatch-specific DNA-glycosylase [Chloroflexota bacterium]
MKTLPDYLEPGLDIVFVGINPGEYSAKTGRYYARKSNRFWCAVNQSGLFGEPLDSESDYRVLEYGIGLTDVVKRPTRSASDLTISDYREAAPILKNKIRCFRPLIVCFQGMEGYRYFLEYGEGVKSRPKPGLQPRLLEHSRVFLVPNPSREARGYTLEDLVSLYRRLRVLRDELKAD